MKLIHIVGLLLLILLGWFAWTRLPGVRTKVSNTVEEVGGWTKEARETDPVGFITFAEEKLAKDIEEFELSRKNLAASKTKGEAERKRHEGLVSAAGELAAQYKLRFQEAEASGAWPIQFKGATYDREQFVEQVDSILAEQATSERVIGIYTEVIQTADDRDKDLKSRIQSTKATLVELKAKKELVRVEKREAEADQLLAQVDELLGGNAATLGNADEPVRSIEDLLTTPVDSPPSTDSDALEFLTTP